MAGQLKLRRGTTSQLANFIGSEGELTYNTTLRSLVLHDGVTLGGVKIPYLYNGLVPPTMLPTATESVVGASKIATTAIAQAGVNDTDIITAKKLSSVFLNNKVESGYQKYPNGKIEQWGIATATGNKTVVFPLSFTSIVTHVSITYLASTPTNTTMNPMIYRGNLSLSGMVIFTGTAAAEQTIMWKVEGY